MASVSISRVGRAEPAVLSHRLHSVSERDYSWNDVHLAPFEVHGLIALRAPDGTGRFNVLPHLPRRRIAMNWHRTYSNCVEALALCTLLVYRSLEQPITPIVLYQSARGRGISIVQAFGEDCLCSMPRRGGCIPMEALDAWWEEYCA